MASEADCSHLTNILTCISPQPSHCASKLHIAICMSRHIRGNALQTKRQRSPISTGFLAARKHILSFRPKRETRVCLYLLRHSLNRVGYLGHPCNSFQVSKCEPSSRRYYLIYRDENRYQPLKPSFGFIDVFALTPVLAYNKMLTQFKVSQEWKKGDIIVLQKPPRKESLKGELPCSIKQRDGL